MSFNINGDGGEGPNAWPLRVPFSAQTIERWAPALIGLQEVTAETLELLRSHLRTYDHVPGSLYGDVPPRARTPILWRRDRLELLECGEFWFSETPNVESTGWDVPYPMGATWVRLRDRHTRRPLLHLNTHYEDESHAVEARRQATRLIVGRAREIGDEMACILTGDFNVNPSAEPYRLLTEAGFVDAHRAAGHGDSARSSTFHGWQGRDYFALEWGEEMYWRVDWILVRGGAHLRTRVHSSEIVHDGRPPLYPSDHFPIVAEVSFEPRGMRPV
jgi:endonuclease/exonuclease/phosphatase family metal-dependent hydrolase